MKLQIISANKIKIKEEKGFLIPEIMLAFSLMTLFLVSVLVLSSSMSRLHEQARAHLVQLEMSTKEADLILKNGTTTEKLYGNDTKEIDIEPLSILISDYENGWGRDNCNPRVSFDFNKIHFYSQGVDLGIGNTSTDIEVRNGIVYLTADSSIASLSDFYIIDATDPYFPFIISSINTGPGLSALEIAGHYAYLANTGTTNQLQILDIQDRSSPVILSKTKLPLPMASSTSPGAVSIFYRKGLIYLGTPKWDGNEFSVFDVSNPFSPQYLGGWKTGTLINDIYVKDDLAYLATSDEYQMRILDISHPSSIFLKEYFSPSGWETQEGKTLSYFERKLSLGRTTGGFNVLKNHEIFSFSTIFPIVTQYSSDIPGGVYGIIMRPPYTYFVARSVSHEFQIWDQSLSKKLFEVSLNFLPHGFVCDRSNFYFGTGDRKGLVIITNE